MRTDKEQKEIIFLYEKHNKTTKYKLDEKNCMVEFPKYISNILNKTKKRTAREIKLLSEYRKKVLHELMLQSWALEREDQKRIEEQNHIITEKIKKTKEEKNRKNPNKIKHFGVWLDIKPTSKINRANYAIIDKRNSCGVPASVYFYKQNPKLYSEVFENENCTTYTDKWCEKHREKCLLNFDLNMKYMEKLSASEFNGFLDKLLKKYKKFEQIFDLNDVDSDSGIYILVLDEYKQVYIGQTINLKRRIMSHWSRKKPFDRLLFGKIENSVLSIDSFGALDTTRIYVWKKNFWLLHSEEEKILEKIDKRFCLNRTGGGIEGNDLFAQLAVVANANKRNL